MAGEIESRYTCRNDCEGIGPMVKLESYWRSNREWFHFDAQGCVLNDDAPEEAKRSYQLYLQQLSDIDRMTKRYFVILKGQAGIDSLERGEDPNWEDESFETDLLVVFVIPYDEFCRIREVGFEKHMEECGDVLHEDGVRELLSVLKEMDVPEIKGALSNVLEWHSYVEYCAQRII